MDKKLFHEVELLQAGTTCEPVRERIIRETELTVRINGEPFATAMVLAGHEKDYAAGLLYTQGIIQHAQDIGNLSVTGETVDVAMAAVFPPRPLKPVQSTLTVHHDDIFACVRAILESPVFTETEAVHSAGLFLEGRQAVAITEDLGRAHALDKVIGAALLGQTDFSRLAAASTGRQPSEMIIKLARAGIPIIATKGVPTTAAVELAERYAITIAGLVRGDRMIVYTHPERIQ